MSDVIVNKVAESGIITLNLENYIPGEEMASFDLKDHLFIGMILKEKDFREALKNLDWTIYSGKNVNITCTADAIIPLWAYMLVTSYLQPVAKYVFAGTAERRVTSGNYPKKHHGGLRFNSRFAQTAN